MNVEVERKFVCDPDIQKKLKDIGGVVMLWNLMYLYHEHYHSLSYIKYELLFFV